MIVNIIFLHLQLAQREFRDMSVYFGVTVWKFIHVYKCTGVSLGHYDFGNMYKCIVCIFIVIYIVCIF